MKKHLLIVIVALLITGCVELTGQKVIPGYEYAGSFEGEENITEGRYHGRNTHEHIVYHVYFKPSAREKTLGLLIQKDVHAKGRYKWGCQGIERENRIRGSIYTQTTGEVATNIRALLNKQGVKLYDVYEGNSKFDQCSGKLFSIVSEMAPVESGRTEDCLTCWVELADGYKHDLYSYYTGIIIECDGSLEEKLLREFAYNRSGLEIREKLIMYFDSLSAPQKAAAMVLRKSVHGEIPRDFDKSGTVLLEETLEMFDREFVKRVKVYGEESKVASLLRKNGVNVQSAVLSLEFTGYMDASKTSEIVIAYSRVISDAESTSLQDGTLSSAERQFLAGFGAEAEDMLNL